MEQTVTQAPEEITHASAKAIDGVTQTSVKVPTDTWLEFRGTVTRRGRTVNDCLKEAIRLWLSATK